jgi:hypothetical protein
MKNPTHTKKGPGRQNKQGGDGFPARLQNPKGKEKAKSKRWGKK